MTEAEYNNAEVIRRSDLWKMNDSPEKFKWFMENPVEKTPAMTFGAACHKWILEAKYWGSDYVIAPNVDRRTKAGKEEWEQFLEDSAGKEVVSQDDFDTMDDMANVLMSNEIASELLYSDRQVEVPIFWTDPETKERCKAKLDVLKQIDGRYVIVDYKTAQYADTRRFNSEVWKLGYYYQAGMYAEGLQISAGLEYLPRFVFVVQEKKAPYSVNAVEVDWETMNAGRAKFHELLQRYHECKEVDIWPGYVTGMDNLNQTSMPGWAMNTDEEGEWR